MPLSAFVRRVAAIIVATTAMVACHATGAAAIGVESFSLAPTDQRASVRSDIEVDLSIADAEDDIRDLTLDLPTGLFGNPTSAARCTEDQLNADACPAASVVGSTSVDATATLPIPILPIGLPITSAGTVYNVVPPEGEPARLGIIVRPLGLEELLGPNFRVTLIGKIRVRDESDYGLTATIEDIPNQLSGIPLDITGLSLTLDSSFMINPTSCDPATSRVEIVGRSGSPTSATGTSTFTPTDCDSVPFEPAITSTAADPRADVATAYTVTLGQPEDVGDGTRTTSHVRRAQVTTPPGVVLNPAIAPDLQVCSDAQFGAQGDPEVNCPAASRIGEVALETPLLGTLPGIVYFGRTAAEPYRLLVVAENFGVTVKLKAEVVPDPATGQLTTTFPDIPAVPFTNFRLTFRGGSTSVLTTPATCGTANATSSVRPYSGTPDKRPTATQEIGGCQTELAPTLANGRSTEQAKADTNLGLDLVRPSDSAVPRNIRVTLAAGQLARFFSVPFCPDAAIATGDCPPESRIGSLTATIGTGATTVDLPGTVFLASGGDQSLGRVVLVIPATVGPIALGTFVLPTTLNIDPLSARVTVDAAVPEAFNGIQLRLRQLRLDVDRPNFVFNPTGCEQRSAQVDMAGGGLAGSGATLTQATGCGALPFTPTIRAEVPTMETRAPGAFVPLRVTLTEIANGSALKQARVTIPSGLTAQTDTLVNVCQARQLAQGACPPATRIGTAYARTPLLPYPLEGPVFLAQTGRVPDQQGGISLPYAVAMLAGGPVRVRVDGELKLGRDGGLIGRFPNVPDVPLDEFRLDFDSRVFKAATDLCSTTRGPATAMLTAHSRATLNVPVPVVAAACGPRAAVTMSARGVAGGRPSGRVQVTSSPVAGKLRQVELQLPRELRPTGSRARVRVSADGQRLAARSWRIRRSGRMLVRLPADGRTRVDVTLLRGSLRTRPAARRKAQRLLRKNTAATLRLGVTARGTDTVRRPSLRVGFDALVRR